MVVCLMYHSINTEWNEEFKMGEKNNENFIDISFQFGKL